MLLMFLTLFICSIAVKITVKQVDRDGGFGPQMLVLYAVYDPQKLSGSRATFWKHQRMR